MDMNFVGGVIVLAIFMITLLGMILWLFDGIELPESAGEKFAVITKVVAAVVIGWAVFGIAYL